MVETRIIEAQGTETEIILDTPAGLVKAWIDIRNGKAESVTIENVPDFLCKPSEKIEVPDDPFPFGFSEKQEKLYGIGFEDEFHFQKIGAENSMRISF
jgi:hypothetical protein